MCRILAVELTCAARAIEMRAPLQPSRATATVIGVIRAQVDGAGPDRWLSPELAIVEQMVRSGAVIDAVTESVGELL